MPRHALADIPMLQERSSGSEAEIMVDRHGGIAGPLVRMTHARPLGASRHREDRRREKVKKAQCYIFVMEI